MQFYLFPEKHYGMENNDRTVTKKKAAGCQDEGYKKFLFLRIVFISTFCANIVGKIQSFNQGSITEKKDNYWNIRCEYKIYNHVNFARQVRFVAPRPIAGVYFIIAYFKEKSWKTVLEVQIRAIAFLIFSSFKRRFELKGFNIA